MLNPNNHLKNDIEDRKGKRWIAFLFYPWSNHDKLVAIKRNKEVETMSIIEEKLVNAITEVIQTTYNITPTPGMVMIEIPKDTRNGDYSTNIAMRLKKYIDQNPRDIALQLVEPLNRLDIVESVSVAGPGFINFVMKKSILADCIKTILEQTDTYGQNNRGNGEKVLVEYVSANPTGILHLGHARGAAWGDALTRMMKASGYDVLREYYVNDAGAQIDNLGKSLLARYKQRFGIDAQLPEDGYYGEDVKKIAEDIANEYGEKFLDMDETESIEWFKSEGKKRELKRIENDLDLFRVHFDSWISEKSFTDAGKVEEVVQTMIDKGLTYEQDGALWFRSSLYGDDKDRVLRKSDGYYTYLTPDIANHVHKLERGYTHLVNLWGADHHGYIPRMKAALSALGYPADCLDVDIIQMVRLIEDGKEVKMSKRTGNAVTIRELCEDIGVDAARYFFVARALDTHLDFDLGLARSESNDNPVYYAQYAHARICSIINGAGEYDHPSHYDLLNDPHEVELLKLLNEFTNTLSDCAATRSPNKMCNYIHKLAATFHSFYGACKVNDADNKALSAQRLDLCKATGIVLKNALHYIGVSAPEHM